MPERHRYFKYNSMLALYNPFRGCRKVKFKSSEVHCHCLCLVSVSETVVLARRRLKWETVHCLANSLTPSPSLAVSTAPTNSLYRSTISSSFLRASSASISPWQPPQSEQGTRMQVEVSCTRAPKLFPRDRRASSGAHPTRVALWHPDANLRASAWTRHLSVSESEFPFTLPFSHSPCGLEGILQKVLSSKP